ncbi:MAG: hypothetical protein IJ560_04440 [Alphaproteobacteria bacterium]|nr:hypothetical protein [Alphaproteobacteria bacterium]
MKKLKRLQNKLNVAMIGIMVSVPAFADGICELIDKMESVFKLLRTLAFIGAAFIIAGWAWGFISKGEVKLEEVQKKGVGMLVGFVILFAIGIGLSFFLSSAGQDVLGIECADRIKNFGMR